MEKSDGMNYAPQGKPAPVVQPGEFVFAAMALDHGHIYGQCNGLTEAGGELRYVYDPDPEKVEAFRQKFPKAQPLRSEAELLEKNEVHLVAAAAVPSERGPLGLRVMDAGKDYFTDKTPFTEMAQLEAARKKVAETGKKYMVYYSERLHVECAVFAGQLIEDGTIGRVVSVTGFGPHRLNAATRPAWFFEKAKYGGILCDIGSHQFEQFLFYAGAKDARVVSASVGNFASPEYPDLEDFGEASLVADNGATNYIRVDWLTPAGLRTWGDGRTFILGTKGYIELRKYTNIATETTGDHLFLVNDKGERHLRLDGKVGFPFFGKLIHDCLSRTEEAMTQEHAFKAAELCLKAQAAAVKLT
ncbi:MAG TPA: Gfo/Idh/MocA family oxidoreductase [Chthoniobacteraceae bacterium]|nr:Gfo/Idh/MocA family oxidoreductase [Chthoniobacteraceae bacterium]